MTQHTKYLSNISSIKAFWTQKNSYSLTTLCNFLRRWQRPTRMKEQPTMATHLTQTTLSLVYQLLLHNIIVIHTLEGSIHIRRFNQNIRVLISHPTHPTLSLHQWTNVLCCKKQTNCLHCDKNYRHHYAFCILCCAEIPFMACNTKIWWLQAWPRLHYMIWASSGDS